LTPFLSRGIRLPFYKSVIFSRGKLTVAANHEFLFGKAERDKIISSPFEYDRKEAA